MASDTHNVTAKNSFLKNTYLMAMTVSHLQEYGEKWCLLNVALTSKDFLDVALDELWEDMHSFLPLLELLPALQVKDDEYFLAGNVSKEDWDRLQYYSRRVKRICIDSDTDCFQVHPSIYIRIAQFQSSALVPFLRHLVFHFTEGFGSHIFLFLSPLLASLELHNFRGFENTVVGPFLATLLSSPLILRRIVLRSGRMPADILENCFVHFKQLRSVEIMNAVLMTDFGLWEVLGTLPSLENLIMEINDAESHPAHAPGNSNRQSGDLRYFSALESLQVTGPFFFIQHLLGFIDSPCLKSIEVSPYRHNSEREHDAGDLLIPSMTIVASKWSQSLKEIKIGSHDIIGITHRNSKFLTPLADLHEIQKFDLVGWRMEKNNDALKRLAMSWPKLRHLGLLPGLTPNDTFLSLSNLRTIAENCPELRILDVGLDIDNIPPFDDISSKILFHELDVLVVRGVYQTIPQISQECQIQIARHLDLIFPYVRRIDLNARDRTWSGICDLVKLCQEARRGR